MTLNDYQELAMTTCMESCNNISYMLLNLQGEVGEFSSKLAKAIRKGNAVLYNNILISGDNGNDITSEEIDGLRAEAGDILWQLSGLCRVMGWDLEEVARQNLAKLQSRRQRGVIDGNGDNR